MAMNKEDELGALWVRQGRNGDFFSGKLTINGEAIEIVVFSNTHKQPGEKSPDWRIYKSQPREGYAPAPQQQRAPQAAPRRAPPPAADLDDEIPFVWLAPLLVPGLALLSLAGVA
jgi:hypothetical protein